MGWPLRELFVGRDRELADLRSGLADAIGGRGGSYVVAGEPGIGKTALAERLADHAAAQGARVVWGRAWEGGSAAPYWTWIQILRELVTQFDDDACRSLLTPELAGQLALLVPELAPADRPTATAVPGPDADPGRFHLFDATTRFLKGAASQRPLVLVLDDLLAGDAPSLQLLRFLLRGLPGYRMLVVATHRDVAPPGSPESTELLAELVREGRLLRLRGLDRVEVARLVADIAGVDPWPAKLAAIHAATEGNPLFVREVTRLVAAEEPLDRPGGLTVPVPDSVRAVIRRRLTPLSADAAQVLSAAAVVGRDFDLPLASTAADLPPERVLDSLSEAVALGLVREVLPAVGGYRFAHPLMREVVYDGLPLPVRTQIHQRVGETIERLPGAASHAGELAYHFAQVASAEAASKAAGYGWQAGDQAMSAYAYEEAAAQYRRALAVARLASLTECARGELLLRLGDALARSGEYQPARESFLQAAELARKPAVPQRLARAALGLGTRQVDGGMVDHQLVALLREALAGLSHDDDPLRVRVLGRLSLELTFSDDPVASETRDSLSQQAVAMAQRLGEVATLANAYRYRWMAVWGPDGLPERTALSGELIRLARETGDREQELSARVRRLTCAWEAGDMVSVDTDLARHAQLAGELRVPYHDWSAASMRAGRVLLDGAFGRAERLAEQAVPLLPTQPNTRYAYGVQLALIRWQQGRLPEFAAGAEGSPEGALDQGWLAIAEAERGSEQMASQRLRARMAEVGEQPRGGLWLPALAVCALAAWRLADREVAVDAYGRLLPYADRVVIVPMPHPVACLGSVALYLGLLASVAGRWDEATGHFQAAVAKNARLGAAALRARTRLEYARMLVQRGRAADRPLVRELLAQAESTAEALGLTEISDGCTRLREPPVAKEEARVAPPHQPGGSVFRREGDYWTVVYDGTLVRLGDSKGLRLLARLLAEPGREFHAVDLAAATERAGPAGARAPGRDDGLVVHQDLGDAGALLDSRAKAEYRHRIAQLREDLAEAESRHEPDRAAKLTEELDFITRELARAVGLGGRDRRAAAHAERARLNVTRAIRAAIGNLARGNTALGEHLELAVRTGRYCRYAPDPGLGITWEIR